MIVFQTNTAIPIEAFTTFGVNSKPNTDNPIGYFGTGLKYALSVVLRLGGTFRLFVEDVEYEFFIKDMDFRGKEFQAIKMRKRRGLGRWRTTNLPFTTELGKNWEPWMAFRELESNTRDENGVTLKLNKPLEDRSGTIMEIDCLEVEDVYDDIHNVFLDYQKPVIYENTVLEVREGGSKFIFYRGLRVTELDKPSCFTYNFKHGVELTEDRTSKYPHYDRLMIRTAIVESSNERVVKEAISQKDMFETGLDFDEVIGATPSPTYTQVVGSYVSSGTYVHPRVKSGYERRLAKTKDPHILVSLPVKDVKDMLERGVITTRLTDILKAKIRDVQIDDSELPF